MKTFILFVVALFLISCKGQKIERGALYGSFYNDKKYSKDYQLVVVWENGELRMINFLFLDAMIWTRLWKQFLMVLEDLKNIDSR